MVNYKDLGLVNTREMFAKAIKGGYAIPAFNFNNMEQMQAIIKAAVETKSPVILQVSKGARQYANATLLRYMAQGAVEYAKELGCAHPEIVLHLDHGDTFETCKSCIDSGFSSVMIDGSHLPYEENVALRSNRLRYSHWLRLFGYLNRYFSRCLQIYSGTMPHRPEDWPYGSSSIGFRSIGRCNGKTSGIPYRSSRIIFSSGRRSGNYQQIWWCTESCYRYSGRRIA